LAPFHRVGENPTLALKRDLQLIEQLDMLGYDEAWIGEHHSYGREIIADPAAFIAAAAERTRRIKLGSGVVSLPYHHPLMTADCFVLRDARLQLANYSEPHLPVAVAATFTPTGPMAAGKHGIGLLSVAGAAYENFENTWGWVEEAAAEAGQTVDRGEWRLVVQM